MDALQAAIETLIDHFEHAGPARAWSNVRLYVAAIEDHARQRGIAPPPIALRKQTTKEGHRVVKVDFYDPYVPHLNLSSMMAWHDGDGGPTSLTARMRDDLLSALRAWRNFLKAEPAKADRPRPMRQPLRDVEAKLLAMQAQGRPYKPYTDMAAEIGCSKSTVSNAFKRNSKLRAWRNETKEPTAPRAVSIRPEEGTADTPDPAKQVELADVPVDAIIAELLDGATPAERSTINAKTPEEQRKLAEAYCEKGKEYWRKDRDGETILGRKP